jgi:hypothetical protein
VLAPVLCRTGRRPPRRAATALGDASAPVVAVVSASGSSADWPPASAGSSGSMINGRHALLPFCRSRAAGGYRHACRRLRAHPCRGLWPHLAREHRRLSPEPCVAASLTALSSSLARPESPLRRAVLRVEGCNGRCVPCAHPFQSMHVETAT